MNIDVWEPQPGQWLVRMGDLQRSAPTQQAAMHVAHVWQMEAQRRGERGVTLRIGLPYALMERGRRNGMNLPLFTKPTREAWQSLGMAAMPEFVDDLTPQQWAALDGEVA